MLQLGVVGSPLSHSLSPVLHQAAFCYLQIPAQYKKYEVISGNLMKFISNHTEICGLSITMPLKQEAFTLAAYSSAYSSATATANTLVIKSKDMYAANTDIIGIIQAFNAVQWAGNTSTVAILGGGATARSALVGLGKLGVREVTIYLRTNHKAAAVLKRIAYTGGISVSVQNIEKMVFHTTVLNTLPTHASLSYIDKYVPKNTSTLFEVNYAKWPTAFAIKAYEAGATVISGLEMLLYQAVAQVKIFSGKEFDESEMLHHMRAAVRM